jgi:hypothetical protein
MFARNGSHNRVTDYSRDRLPDNELSIHTWMDADLRELADLVKQTQSSARHRDATMEFSIVYPDRRGMNVMKVVRITIQAVTRKATGNASRGAAIVISGCFLAEGCTQQMLCSRRSIVRCIRCTLHALHEVSIHQWHMTSHNSRDSPAVQYLQGLLCYRGSR